MLFRSHLPDHSGDFKAAVVADVQVNDKEVGLVRNQRIQNLRRAGNADDIDIFYRQILFRDRREDIIVIDNENDRVVRTAILDISVKNLDQIEPGERLGKECDAATADRPGAT